MATYIIKSICTFEIECDDDAEALKAFEEGDWDQNDLTDEIGIELLTLDHKHLNLYNQG